MYKIEHDGHWVHAELGDDWDDDKYDYIFTTEGVVKADEYFNSCIVPILNELGEPIPIDVCICAAYNPYECGCATTYWDNYKLSEFDFE